MIHVKNRIRNVCMDKIPKLKIQKNASGEKTVLIMDDNDNGKWRPLNTPKTALYWGGIIGDASGKFAGNSDGNVTTKYLNNVISFVKEKNINVLFLSVDSTSKFMFDNNGEWVVKNLLENKYIKNIEIGIVVYIRPKDSPYTYDESALGAPISGSKDVGKCNTVKAPTSKCTPNKNYTNCGLDTNPKDCKKQSEKCYIVGGNEPTEYSCCKGLACNHDTFICEACDGCPNIAGQVIKWIADINNKSTGEKITYFTVDGEDAGEYNSVCGWNQISQLNNLYKAGLKNFGFAKGLAAGITGSVENNNMVMPETYWYMNETTPCTGSAYQLKNMPEICTTNISYRKLVNKPAEFVNWLMTSSRCGADTSMNGLLKNIQSYPDVFWPMFSLENLSMGTGAVKCLASEFFPCSSKTDCGKKGAKPQLCGTFDGFAYWDWDQFYMFYVYFANVVGAKQIGIYEAQFVPPHWFESGKYPFPYKRNNCNPSLPGNKTYKYCDPTWNNTKGNWCKFKTDSAYGTCATPDPDDKDKVTYCNCKIQNSCTPNMCELCPMLCPKKSINVY